MQEQGTQQLYKAHCTVRLRHCSTLALNLRPVMGIGCKRGNQHTDTAGAHLGVTQGAHEHRVQPQAVSAVLPDLQAGRQVGSMPRDWWWRHRIGYAGQRLAGTRT